jgi:acyl-CoA reductase-like NAD-dependent aldehyde dehydrogenase
MAAAIRAGVVRVNTYGWFDVAVPYGGFGLSGSGEELGQLTERWGSRQTPIGKTIWAEQALAPDSPIP